MLKTIVLITAISAFAGLYLLGPDQEVTSLEDSEVLRQFLTFATKFAKKYTSTEEFNERLSTFAKKYTYVREYNSLGKSAKLGMTFFSDLTSDEASNYMGLLIDNEDETTEEDTRLDQIEPAESIDWRELGGVKPIRNQGKCGSCWAFSAAGALEGAHFAWTGELLEFSEQQLMDCSWSTFGNHACSGGFLSKAFKHWANHPASTEEQYPYREKKHSCKEGQFEHTEITTPKYHKIKQKYQPERMVQALNQQPVSIAVQAN